MGNRTNPQQNSNGGVRENRYKRHIFNDVGHLTQLRQLRTKIAVFKIISVRFCRKSFDDGAKFAGAFSSQPPLFANGSRL